MVTTHLLSTHHEAPCTPHRPQTTSPQWPHRPNPTASTIAPAHPSIANQPHPSATHVSVSPKARSSMSFSSSSGSGSWS